MVYFMVIILCLITSLYVIKNSKITKNFTFYSSKDKRLKNEINKLKKELFNEKQKRYSLNKEMLDYKKMYIKLYNEMNKIGCISEGNIPLKIVKHTMENIEKNYRI